MSMSKTSTPDALSVEPAISLADRFAACWREKLWLMLVANIFFWAGYIFLSRHALFPAHKLPMTWLDNRAGFQPHPWAWVYESNFALVGIVPWLIATRGDLRRYVFGFALLALVSFLMFALYPVASPRPPAPPDSPFLVFITTVDGPLNAFPSLHAGTLVYALIWVKRLFGRTLHPLVATGLLVWALLILFATLATKQHYAIDLAAGGVLGWLAGQIVSRRQSHESMTAANTRRSSGVASQAG
jgi:membrane-associated phospholipid phosphatase